MSGRKKLRSAAWFGGSGKNAFMYRSWMTPCNAHLRNLADHVKRGGHEFEVSVPVFGKPLRNRMEQMPDEGLVAVRAL